MSSSEELSEERPFGGPLSKFGNDMVRFINWIQE